MSRFRRVEIIEPYYYPSSIFTPKALAIPSFVLEEEEEAVDDLSFALDCLSPCPSFFDSVTDLIKIEETTPFYTYKRIQQRVSPEFWSLRTLCDRVSALESSFDRLLTSTEIIPAVDKKYTWTAEIKGLDERKYKWTAEIKGEKKKKTEEKKVGMDKKYKWTAEIKEAGPTTRKYTFEASNGVAAGEKSGLLEKKEKKNSKKKGECSTRLVEIEDAGDHGAVVLRQAFAKRARGARNIKGKQKELSPQDAALVIQMSFRAYLIRRSRALRALRELAIAKAKLKEIRALFNNFSYRRHVARDAEERQKFSEKIIVLLLTVDAIQGADLMVRAAKRSMVDELEAMLDVVDPQPSGKLLSMKRRTFDMPDGVVRKEIAEGVAQVVHMINEENGTFEACL